MSEMMAVVAPEETWSVSFSQIKAAVSEGLCPVHGTALTPAQVPGAPVAGHCAACRKYWHTDFSTGWSGWVQDDNPDIRYNRWTP